MSNSSVRILSPGTACLGFACEDGLSAESRHAIKVAVCVCACEAAVDTILNCKIQNCLFTDEVLLN